MAPGIVGFWREDAKPLGPVQLYVALATAGVDSCRVAPTQTGPLFEAVGVAGNALTVVEAFAESFPEAGSFVAEETETVFVAVPAAPGALIAIVIAGAAPVGSDARVHVTVDVPPHAQPDPLAETKPAPAGSASDTETDVAVEGPPLETFKV